MCQTPEKSFLFCSCTNEKSDDKKAAALPHLRWVLSRTENVEMDLPNERIRGMVMIPDAELEHGPDTEAILQKLEGGTLFDFEYRPRDNDLLKVHYNSGEPYHHHQFIALVYQQGSWQRDDGSTFRDTKEELAFGRIFDPETPASE